MGAFSRRDFFKSFLASLIPAFFYPITGLFSRSLSCPSLNIVKSTKDNYTPGYLTLHRSGILRERAQKLWDIMESCELCPRQCGVNRMNGEKGFCGASSQLRIASYHPHYGEERPLVGGGGSGTIFFSHCSLRCVFCINWEISQGGDGYNRSIEEFAKMMISLQKRGCSNINIVTIGIVLTVGLNLISILFTLIITPSALPKSFPHFVSNAIINVILFSTIASPVYLLIK